MKKFLYIIGFLMFSSALFSPAISRTALGADPAPGSSPTDESGCSFPWVSCNTASRMQVSIPDTDWGATFGKDKPEDVGQDLYKNILGMTRVAPEQKAIKNTAGAFGTTEGNMNRLLNNDFGPILDKSPYLTQDEAIKKMVEIQKRYQDEKDIYDIQSDIDAATMPNEIFQNGDTSDSGFDLINDLNNIENILFKKMDPIDIGGAFDASSSGGSGTTGAPGTPGSKTGPTSPVSGPSSGSGSTGTSSSALTASGSASGSTGPGGSGAGADASGLGEKPSATENPNICFADGALDKALEDFDSKKTTDSHYKETPTAPKTGGDTGSDGSGGSGGGGGGGNDEKTGTTSSALSAPGEFDFNPPASQGPAQPAPADNWLKAPPCTDVLCIQVNFVKAPASAYVDSDNCIACHVEKINEKLKYTINHSLIPGKATGNLLEPGICKQATADLLRSVNIRFYAVAKPVLTPTNDDLIYGSNITDEWDKFVNTYKPFPFYEKNVPDPKDPKKDTFAPDVTDRAVKSAVAYATPDTSISSVNRSVQQQIQGAKDNISRAAAVVEPALQSDTDSSFYQSIRRELEQMNQYFQSFQDIIHRLHEKVGDVDEDHACVVLNENKQCQ